MKILVEVVLTEDFAKTIAKDKVEVSFWLDSVAADVMAGLVHEDSQFGPDLQRYVDAKAISLVE